MLVNASFVAHYIRAKTKQVAPSVNNLATNPRFAPSQAIKTVGLVGPKLPEVQHGDTFDSRKTGKKKKGSRHEDCSSRGSGGFLGFCT